VAQVTPEARDGLMASMMGLSVQGVGRLIKDPGHVRALRPRTLNAFAAVYLDGGGGIFESGPTGRREVRSGTLFVLFPGVAHFYGPRERERWREYWAIFDGFIPERYRRTGLLDPTRPFFRLGQDAALIRRWRECLYLAESRRPRRAQELAEKFFALLGHVFANARRPGEGEPARQRAVEGVIALMEEQLDRASFPLEDCAARFFMSYSALRKRFREATGLSPARYFARMKMRAARAQLLATGDSVKEIGARLGFPDPYHFSRRFKQLVGLSPQHFRRAFRAGRVDPERPVSP
jgi:AraC-like DNA-binding protein